MGTELRRVCVVTVTTPARLSSRSVPHKATLTRLAYPETGNCNSWQGNELARLRLYGPRWCTVGMIMRAWLIVGVSQTGLDPTLIPKERLVGDRLNGGTKNDAHKARATAGNTASSLTTEQVRPPSTKLSIFDSGHMSRSK